MHNYVLINHMFRPLMGPSSRSIYIQ